MNFFITFLTIASSITANLVISNYWLNAQSGETSSGSSTNIMNSRPTQYGEVNAEMTKEILVRNSSSLIPQNHHGAPEGTYPSVVDVYYLHLRPLSPGKHILASKIVHEDPNGVDVGNKPRGATGEASYVTNVK